jgi:hypothetical protein
VIHLMSRARYTASNNVGSASFYSVAAGVPHFMLGEPPPEVTPDDPALARSLTMSTAAASRVEGLRAMYSERVDEITDEQRACAEEYLGASRFKSREDLMCDLQFAATGR